MSFDHEAFYLAVQAARLPVWEYDVLTDSVTGNEHWHGLRGHPVSEAEARRRSETWLEGIHPEDIPKLEGAFADGRADESGFFEVEYRIQVASGGYKWLLERGRVVQRAVDGLPLRVVGISLDIDERKRAEQSLRDSELRLTTVIETAPVPFALNDEHGNITFLNRAFIDTFGYTLTNMPTLAVWWERAYPDPAYRQWVQTTWAYRLEAALKDNSPFKGMEVIIRCADGTDRTAFAFATPLAGMRTPTHLVVLLDLTEHRLLEQKILAAVSSEQHRIGMDLHDGLGQQLTGLSLILAAVARHPDLDGKTALTQDLERLSALAGECVASARAIAHGLLPIESGVGAFGRMLQRLVDSTRRLTGLTISLSTEGMSTLELPPAISAPLYRIVQEALTNAIKHAQATMVRIRVRLHDGSLRLSVADDGRGTFDPHATEGLGISIMRYRARALGGRLEVGRRRQGGTFVRCTCRVDPIEKRPE